MNLQVLFPVWNVFGLWGFVGTDRDKEYCCSAMPVALSADQTEDRFGMLCGVRMCGELKRARNKS